MQFPLQLSYGMLLYSEDQGGEGVWTEIDSVELKIPKQWDLDGQMLDYNSYVVGEGDVLGTITIQHSTDLHHCANIKQLAHYQVQAPPKAEDFQYIFFKRQTDEDYIFIDIIGFNIREPQFEALLNFVLTSMVYESRYSQLGIQKQVEDAVEVIMYSVLKKMIRAIGKIKNIQYTTMMELAGQVILEPIKLESADIYSIVYKTMISKGLFPIHCEINTMNDSYFKLKLLSLFTNSEILPWSPKFHASLALANFHYSFTPNDLFNLRKLDQRKFHAGYQYIRLRILDFFPLDSWVEEIADFFCKHQMVIYYFLRKNLQTNERPQRSSSQSQRKNQQDEQTSRSSVLSELKQPFLGEEDKQIELMYDNRYINRKASLSFIDLPFQDLFKFQLKKSIQSLKFTQQLYGLEIEKFYLVEITKKIAREFYQNYSSELQDSGMMSKFCQIITETELRKYDTCANNCQTPVAAFIYQLCDTFRENSEVLYKKNKVIECLRSRTESVHIKNFVKYGSQVNQRILGAIQPAYLGQCLDYFGFFSDSLSSTFLKNIQKIDGNPYEFVRKRHSIFGSQGQESKAMEQITYFISLFETNQQLVMSNYQQQQYIEQESFKCQLKELDLHFLMQYFQNEVLKQKQENEKNAQSRHKTQDLLDEVFFYYFNSIRIQLQMKQKRNTLSYIGFVLAKDLDMIST